MSHAVDALMATYKPVIEEHQFGCWTITATKCHILASEGPERQTFEAQLGLPHLPDMIFADNCLRLVHKSGFGMEFTALDALKCVGIEQDIVQVANAKAWKEARADCEHVDNVVNQFDWTFTTDYCGTLLGHDDNSLQVEANDERIDTERLKVRDKIGFYSDVMLFEDELHDSGCSMLSVKIRVMPDYFLVLLRFYMRVDGVVIRVNDTRLFYELGKDFILREYTARESPVSELEVPLSVLTDPVEIVDHLHVRSQRFEKLRFPTAVALEPAR